MSSSRNIIKSRYNKELSSYVSLLEAESAVALADVENAVEEEEHAVNLRHRKRDLTRAKCLDGDGIRA